MGCRSFETSDGLDSSAGKPTVPHGLPGIETSEGLDASVGKPPVPRGLQELEIT